MVSPKRVSLEPVPSGLVPTGLVPSGLVPTGLVPTEMPSPETLSPEAIVTALRAAGCVFAEDEARLLLEAASSPEEFARMLARRVAGLPLEQVVGWVEFFGLRLAVAPGVFVPRRKSELIVREAAAVASPGAVVVDLCCGCGALGRALATAVAEVSVVAADISPAAADCARRNLAPIGGQVFEGDLFEALPDGLRGDIDVLLCNAPYVPSDRIRTLPPEARLHEPQVTLDGGSDGLDVLRRVATAAADWLRAGGRVFVETSPAQAPVVAHLFAAAGLTPRVVHDDALEATAVVGQA
jgi:release factor glutamine methyltransferase